MLTRLAREEHQNVLLGQPNLLSRYLLENSLE
jgi:hypothetical protein